MELFEDPKLLQSLFFTLLLLSLIAIDDKGLRGSAVHDALLAKASRVHI
jgi:hypothetical protein